MEIVKTQQLQLRVSRPEKELIRQAAKRTGMDMSRYVLSRVFPDKRQMFIDLIDVLTQTNKPSFALAEINSLLTEASLEEFRSITAETSLTGLPPYLANYVAAMIEYAASLKDVAAPDWLSRIEPLSTPHFGSDLMNLRLYLLTHAPAPFRKRNIFIDASVGSRV